MSTKFLSGTAAIVCAVALTGVAILPAWAGPPASNMTFDNAVVMPTQQETQRVMAETAERMREAALASFESPVADTDYLAAERDYEFGRYEEAINDAQKADQALPQIPNWSPISGPVTN